MDAQYLKLAEEIRRKSQENRIVWMPSNYVETYEASLGIGTIMISRSNQSNPFDESVSPYYSLSFLNSRGESFYTLGAGCDPESNESNELFTLLAEIYTAALNSYMEIDETLKSMFEDIHSK